MDLARSRGLQHLDDLLGRRAPHDRIVHEDHALAGHDRAHRVQLHLHAEVADGLLRFDERAADVVIAHEPHAVGDPALLRVAERREDPRVGHGHDHIGNDRMLPREAPAEGAPRLGDRLAEDGRVGSREIDVLEDAESRALPHRERCGSRPAGVEDHDLAGLDVAQRLRVDQVEGARLGRDDHRVRLAGHLEAAQRERPDPLRIARGDHSISREEDDRVRAADPAEGLAQRADDVLRPRARHEVEKHLGVRARREDRAFLLELEPKLVGIHQVSVVADRERPLVRLVDDRLSVLETRLARRRVAHVSDRRVPREPRESRLVEDVRDVAHLLLDGHALAGPRHDARGLLTAVLHRVEAEIRQVAGVRVAEDPEDAALVPELVRSLVERVRRHPDSLSVNDATHRASNRHGEPVPGPRSRRICFRACGLRRFESGTLRLPAARLPDPDSFERLGRREAGPPRPRPPRLRPAPR